MATQIRTTVGEVVAACERVIESTTERLSEYTEKRDAAIAEREQAIIDERQAKRDEYDRQYAAWKRQPFFVRWFKEEPRIQMRHGYAHDFYHLEQSVRFEYDVTNNSMLRQRARFLRDSMSGLPDDRTIMLDAQHAIDIGLGDSPKVDDASR